MDSLELQLSIGTSRASESHSGAFRILWPTIFLPLDISEYFVMTYHLVKYVTFLPLAGSFLSPH